MMRDRGDNTGHGGFPVQELLVQQRKWQSLFAGDDDAGGNYCWREEEGENPIHSCNKDLQISR